MKLELTKGDKIFLTCIAISYLVLFLIATFTGYAFSLEGIGQRWIYQLPFGSGPVARINPMTVIMTWAINIGLIVFASTIKVFKLVPGKKQTLVELVLSYILELTEDAVPRKEFIRPTFNIAATLFFFILIANLLSGFPGINVVTTDAGVKFTVFQDTWYTPTSDWNNNLSLAAMVLIISHVFAIKAKGLKNWAKAFIQPAAFMLPMNIVSEIAKPVSHSLRLFGNIMGGGLLVLIISYLVKYTILPPFLWGFFGLFVGSIQALVFTILAIAYIGSVIE